MLVVSDVRFVHVPPHVCMEDAVSYLCCIGTPEIMAIGLVRFHVTNVKSCLPNRSMNYFEIQTRMVGHGLMSKQQMYMTSAVVVTFALTSMWLARVVNVRPNGSRKAGCAKW